MTRLLPLLALLCALPLAAEDLRIPLGQQGDARLQLPAPGTSQSEVLERFGLADEEHPPRGQPPISRWDYREFSVYFEGQQVIDSVRHHHPRYPQQDNP